MRRDQGWRLRDRDLGATLAVERRVEHHVPALCRRDRHQQVMIGELFRRRRPTMSIEVGGASAQDDVGARDTARDEQAVDGPRTLNNDRDVVVLVGRLDSARDGELDGHLGMPLAEHADVLGELMHREAGRRENAQPSSQLHRGQARDGLGVVDLAEDAPGPLEVLPAYVRQRQAPCRAVDEASAQMLFQFRDKPGDHGWRQVQ